MRRSARRVLFAAVLLLVGAHAVVRLRGPDGIQDVFAKRREVADLKDQIERKRQKVEALEKKISGLDKKDRIDIEQRLIDEIPEGEIQFRVDEPKPGR